MAIKLPLKSGWVKLWVYLEYDKHDHAMRKDMGAIFLNL